MPPETPRPARLEPSGASGTPSPGASGASGAASPPVEPREALRRLAAGESLDRAEAEELFGRMIDGEVSDPLKAALLVALRMKGEAVPEIAGAAAAMRRRATPIPHARPAVVDTCGTGGDGRGTFNISTAAALVAAAAGAPVAKHGNRSVSSRSGSADVLAALGVRLDEDAATAGRALEQVGICFLFAPYFHPGMREVMPVRRELALRTIFNLLGPLTNPAGARRQLMGVYAAALVEPIGRVLAELGSEHALVVHGDDGLDEITTTGITRVCEVRGGEVRCYTLEPEALGIRRVELRELAGGGPDENAELMRQVLASGAGPLADVTILNAGAALYVAGLAADIPEGVEQARAALVSGRAADKLAQLVRFLA
jgi:anthranilate phosphoribosyltransferase